MIALTPQNCCINMTKNEDCAARRYYIHAALQVEEKLREGKHLWREMFTVPRNRRAAQSSFFVMFLFLHLQCCVDIVEVAGSLKRGRTELTKSFVSVLIAIPQIYLMHIPWLC
jgi:hypothetical protein